MSAGQQRTRTEPLVELEPRRRTLAALLLLSQEFGLPDDFEQVQRANVWQPAAIAMLAEAVAALALEVDARRRPPRKKAAS